MGVVVPVVHQQEDARIAVEVAMRREPLEVRMEPLGVDSKGLTYWYAICAPDAHTAPARPPCSCKPGAFFDAAHLVRHLQKRRWRKGPCSLEAKNKDPRGPWALCSLHAADSWSWHIAGTPWAYHG